MKGSNKYRHMNEVRSKSHLLRRLSGVELVIALTVLFVAMPLIETLRFGVLIESVLFTLVLVSAVFAIAERPGVLPTALLLAFPTLLARWINNVRPNSLPPEVFLIGGIL